MSCTTATHTPQLLNFDVLDEISLYLRPKALSSFMKTCKTLYRLGIPHILTPPCELLIIHNLKVDSFCKFMLAERYQHDKFCCLRSLSLHFYPRLSRQADLPRIMSSLAQILLRASHLIQLEIPYAEGFFKYSPETLLSLHLLPRLTSLRLGGVWAATAEAFSRVTSPLSYLSLAFQKDVSDGAFSLRRVSNTLVCLCVDNWKSRYIENSECPGVQSLHIACNRIDDMAVIVGVFPNISSFTLETSGSLWCTEQIQALRRTNQAAIRNLPNKWAFLDRLSGSVLAIYASGLECRVHELDIRWINPAESTQVQELLEDLRPQSFRAKVSLGDLTYQDLVDTLVPSCAQLASTCRSLAIKVHCNNSKMEASEVLECLMSQLQQIPLRSLELHFQWRRPFDQTVQALQVLDPNALASEFAHRISGLQVITISLEEEGRFGNIKRKECTMTVSL